MSVTLKDPNVLCIIAMLAYSCEISIADVKLSSIHPRVLTLLYSSGVMIIAAVFVLGHTSTGDWRTVIQWAAFAGLVTLWFIMKTSTQGHEAEAIRWPQGNEWWWAIAMATCSFVGGWSHFAALNNHSGALKLSMYYMLLPVCTSIPTILIKGEWPTWRTLLAWCLAGIAIWLVSSEEKH